MVLTISYHFGRSSGWVVFFWFLVCSVLMVVFCGVARKVRRFLAHVPAIQGVTGASISNDRREAGDITRLALWEKIRDNFFPFG